MIGVAQGEKFFPACDEAGGVFWVGVVADALAACIGFVVDEGGRGALNNAPAFLQDAQAQVYVSEANGEAFVEASKASLRMSRQAAVTAETSCGMARRPR